MPLEMLTPTAEATRVGHNLQFLVLCLVKYTHTDNCYTGSEERFFIHSPYLELK